MGKKKASKSKRKAGRRQNAGGNYGPSALERRQRALTNSLAAYIGVDRSKIALDDGSGEGDGLKISIIPEESQIDGSAKVFKCVEDDAGGMADGEQDEDEEGTEGQGADNDDQKEGIREAETKSNNVNVDSQQSDSQQSESRFRKSIVLNTKLENTETEVSEPFLDQTLDVGPGRSGGSGSELSSHSDSSSPSVNGKYSQPSSNSSASSSENEAGYDSEGMPNPPVEERTPYLRAPTPKLAQFNAHPPQSHSHRRSSANTRPTGHRNHRLQGKTHQKKRAKRPHFHNDGHSHKRTMNRHNNNHHYSIHHHAHNHRRHEHHRDQHNHKTGSGSAGESHRVFLTAVSQQDASKTSTGGIHRSSAVGLQPRRRTEDQNPEHREPLTAAKNRLWGRKARVSFFGKYHDLDRNVVTEQTPSTKQSMEQNTKGKRKKTNEKRRKAPGGPLDPFADFTAEALEAIKEAGPKAPPPLTTTAYEDILSGELEAIAKSTNDEVSRDQLLVLHSQLRLQQRKHKKSQNQVTQRPETPRSVYLRECRDRMMPPVPLLDYYRMGKKRQRLTELVGKAGSLQNRDSATGKRLSTASMDTIEFHGYGLGNERASAYASALRVDLPEPLRVRSLSLRNNNLTAKGATAMLDAIRQVGTVTSLDIAENAIGIDGSKALARLLIGKIGNQKSEIQHCCIAENKLSGESIRIILMAASASPNLQSLDLSGNTIGRRSVPMLRRILHPQVASIQPSGDSNKNAPGQNDSTTKADFLSSFGFDETSSKQIQSPLIHSNYAQLTSLCLRWCGITARNVGPLISGLCYTRTLKFLDLAHNAIGGCTADSASLGVKGSQGYFVEDNLLSEDDHTLMSALAAGDISVASNAVCAISLALSRNYGSFVRGSGGSRVIDIDLSFNSISDADGAVLLSALLPESMQPSSIASKYSDALKTGKRNLREEESSESGCQFERIILDGNNFGRRTARQAFRAIVGGFASKYRENTYNTPPAVYLSLRECNYVESDPSDTDPLLPKKRQGKGDKVNLKKGGKSAKEGKTKASKGSNLDDDSIMSEAKEFESLKAPPIFVSRAEVKQSDSWSKSASIAQKLMSFDIQSPFGVFDLDLSYPLQRYIAQDLLLLGRLSGKHTWVEAKFTARDPNRQHVDRAVKNDKKGNRRKARVIDSSEWYDNILWEIPSLGTGSLSLTFSYAKSCESNGSFSGSGDFLTQSWSGSGVNDILSWAAPTLFWRMSVPRWFSAVKVSDSNPHNRRTQLRLAGTTIKDSNEKFARSAIPMSRDSFQSLNAFLLTNLMPYEDLDPNFLFSGGAGTRKLTHATSPADPGALMSFLCRDRWFTCKQCNKLLQLLNGGSHGTSAEDARINFLVEAIPRLVDAFELHQHSSHHQHTHNHNKERKGVSKENNRQTIERGKRDSLNHSKDNRTGKKDPTFQTSTVPLNPFLSMLKSPTARNSNLSSVPVKDKHVESGAGASFVDHSHHHQKTNLAHLLSHNLSHHGRQLLTMRLGFSPLTPTGHFVLHLSNTSDRKTAAALINYATLMRLHWAQIALREREMAMGRATLEVCEIRRQRIIRKEVRERKRKAAIARRKARQERRDELEKRRQEEKNNRSNNKQDRRFSFSNPEFEKVESDTDEDEEEHETDSDDCEDDYLQALQLLLDDATKIAKNDEGQLSLPGKSNNGKTVASSGPRDSDEVEAEGNWRWAVLALHENQRKCFEEEETKEYNTLPAKATKPANRSISTQKLDADRLASWMSSIDASEQRMRRSTEPLSNLLNPNPPDATQQSEVNLPKSKKVQASKVKSSKTKKQSNKKKNPKSQTDAIAQRRYFSCIRNCTYRQETAAASESIPWLLCQYPLPRSGTIEFDFVASPIVTLRSARSLRHASERDLQDISGRIKSLITIPQHRRRKHQNVRVSNQQNMSEKVIKQNTAKNPKPPITHRNDYEQRIRYDKICSILNAFDKSVLTEEANCIVRIFTASANSSTLEPWAKLPDVVTTVLTRLFSLVRDRERMWMMVKRLPKDVKTLARKRIGWIRLFNPSNPEPQYDLDLRIDEQRRFARILLALGRHVMVDSEVHGFTKEEKNEKFNSRDANKAPSRKIEESLSVRRMKNFHRWEISSADIVSMGWTQAESSKESDQLSVNFVSDSKSALLQNEDKPSGKSKEDIANINKTSCTNIYREITQSLYDFVSATGYPAAVGGNLVPLLPGDLSLYCDNTMKQESSILRIKTKINVNDVGGETPGNSGSDPDQSTSSDSDNESGDEIEMVGSLNRQNKRPKNIKIPEDSHAQQQSDSKRAEETETTDSENQSKNLDALDEKSYIYRQMDSNGPSYVQPILKDELRFKEIVDNLEWYCIGNINWIGVGRMYLGEELDASGN